MKDINWGRVVDVFNSVSTTSVRIYFTLIVVAWTAWDYIIQNDVPDSEWLLFLATLAGVDMVQAVVKTAATSKARATEAVAKTEVEVKNLELQHSRVVNGKVEAIDNETAQKEIG